MLSIVNIVLFFILLHFLTVSAFVTVSAFMAPPLSLACSLYD